MRRLLLIAGLLVLAIPFAQAQRGMRGGGPVARPMPAFRGAPARRFAPMPRGPAIRFAPMFRGPRIGGAPRSRIIRRGFGPSFFTFGHIGRRGVRFRTFPFCDPQFISCQFILSSQFGRRRFFSPFGFGGFGYGGYPGFWDYPSDYTQADAQPAQPIVVYAQPPEAEEERAAPPEPAAQPQAAARQPEPTPVPATVLIFRDQHREEVTNYAIAGDSLYEFLPHGRKKVPISDLDLPATIKANDDRGVEFQMPTHRGS